MFTLKWNDKDWAFRPFSTSWLDIHLNLEHSRVRQCTTIIMATLIRQYFWVPSPFNQRTQLSRLSWSSAYNLCSPTSLRALISIPRFSSLPEAMQALEQNSARSSLHITLPSTLPVARSVKLLLPLIASRPPFPQALDGSNSWTSTFPVGQPSSLASMPFSPRSNDWMFSCRI